MPTIIAVLWLFIYFFTSLTAKTFWPHATWACWHFGIVQSRIDPRVSLLPRKVNSNKTCRSNFSWQEPKCMCRCQTKSLNKLSSVSAKALAFPSILRMLTLNKFEQEVLMPKLLVVARMEPLGHKTTMPTSRPPAWPLSTQNPPLVNTLWRRMML